MIESIYEDPFKYPGVEVVRVSNSEKEDNINDPTKYLQPYNPPDLTKLNLKDITLPKWEMASSLPPELSTTPSHIEMGSSSFALGKGKKIDPNGTYDLFHTFGYGVDSSTKYSGVDCAKKIINTIMGYIDKGVSSLLNIVMMYHLGLSGTWEDAKNWIKKRGGLRDLKTGKWISANEWIQMLDRYLLNASGYTRMSLSTRPSKTRAFLYPLVTFLSRLELGMNSEEATRIALDLLGIK